MNQTKPEESWEERFKNKFIDNNFGKVIDLNGVEYIRGTAEEAIEFIHQVEKEAYWAGIKTMEKEADRAISQAKAEQRGEDAGEIRKQIDVKFPPNIFTNCVGEVAYLKRGVQEETCIRMMTEAEKTIFNFVDDLLSQLEKGKK